MTAKIRIRVPDGTAKIKRRVPDGVVKMKARVPDAEPPVETGFIIEFTQ